MKYIILLAYLALLPIAPVLGQSKPAVPTGPALRTYTGEYEGGRATYTYYLGQGGERVRHGRFELTHSETTNALRLNYQVVATDYTERRDVGSYRDGQRIETWTHTETDYHTKGSSPVRYLSRQQTTTHTYVADTLSGPATYAEVPWQSGKPGLPTEAARARRQVVYTAYQVQETRFGQPVAGTARDTTEATTEYAAGPFRYEAEASASDPTHRRQSVRGCFDAGGYCDSTWTLHYWKNPYEVDNPSSVQSAQGWLTTTLEFSHGLLRQERTVQASTGRVIHQFAPAAGGSNRLQLATTSAHYYNFAPSGNGRPETPDPDWDSPLPEDEDASRNFFGEAMRPLGPPRLLNVRYALVPTAADSALLDQCVLTLNQASERWRGQAEGDTTHAALRQLCQQLYSVLAAAQPLRLAPPTETEASLSRMLTGRGNVQEDEVSSTEEHPTPWLDKLLAVTAPGEDDAKQL